MSGQHPGGRPRILTNEQAATIRQEAWDGVAQVYLAREYGVSPQLVSHIVTGRRYQDAGGPIRQTEEQEHEHE